MFVVKRLPLGAVAAALVLSACGPRQMNVRLDWRGKDDIADLSAAPVDAFSRAKVALGTFRDMRTDKTRIGSSHDGRWSVRTQGDLAQFVRTEVGKLIEDRGGRMAKNGPKKFLTADIEEFFVQEDNIYAARVTLRVRMTDAAGHVGWEKALTGSSNRWGGSWDAENYQEAYSAALFEAVKALMSDPGFMAALG